MKHRQWRQRRTLEVETYTSHVLPVSCGVSLIVGCLGGTSVGASGWCVALALAEREELVAQVSVVALSIEWCVNSATKSGGTIVARDGGWWGVLVVG